MSNDPSPKELSYESFRQYYFDVAKKNNLGFINEKKHSLELFETLDLHSLIIYNFLVSIDQKLTDQKSMPDSRFDRVADEIDKLKEEVEELKQVVKKLKQEKN